LLDLGLVAVGHRDFEFDREFEQALFVAADRDMGGDAGFPNRLLGLARNGAFSKHAA
jgi:hypothetical protein